MLILVRVFYIQIVWGDDLQSKAIDQWTRELPIIAKRGLITDRNGVILVGNEQSYAVFVRTRAVDNPTAVSKTLSSVLNLNESELLNKITNAKSSEITIKRRVNKQIIEKLVDSDLNGVYFSPDNTRIYPYGSSLSQVLGYTSIDGNGQSGIERFYNEYLSGYNGEILYEADLVGKDIQGKNARYIAATDGLTVKLTIDYELQSICDGAIAKAYAQYSPKSASVILIDPTNGQILALSQSPNYDLNDLPRDDIDLLNKLSRCSAITDSYEPGSTFKVLTAAANIEEYLKGNPNAFSLEHIFNSSRYRYVDGKKIKCWSAHEKGKHASENLAMALNNSCNPCFVDIALSLGTEKMYEYITAFGYGQATGIDFDGEALGMLVPKSAVKSGDLARIGFGQTIAVTPIQLAMATACAINGGYYYEPYFVSEIKDAKGQIAQIINPKLKRQAISEKASKILAGYLEGVVANGSGKQAYIDGYRVGGKTGVSTYRMTGVN